ncbi:MAG: hypothetical protein M3Y58_17345 [Chloroflexota bacterium]|nr:hypothetical protein [Chloroflexota bacterium]
MPEQGGAGSTLYYGDNLAIMREYIASASVDLIYLDPPFNSNRNYNVLFKDESGTESESQITAFEDNSPLWLLCDTDRHATRRSARAAVAGR